MLVDTERVCAGSLSIADTEPVPLGMPRRRGRCPYCGAELDLGYAGLLPVHEPTAGAEGQ